MLNISYLLDLPGAFNNTGDGVITIPEYKIEDFRLKYYGNPLFESHWTEWFDGIQFRFDNGPISFAGNPLQLVQMKNLTYSDTLLSDLVIIQMKINGYILRYNKLTMQV